MSKQNYFIILGASLLGGAILYLFKSSVSSTFLLTVLYLLSMFSIASTHGIIAHSIDMSKQKDMIKFPLLMGVVFSVIFFIWVFLIFPLFCPDFIENFKM